MRNNLPIITTEAEDRKWPEEISASDLQAFLLVVLREFEVLFGKKFDEKKVILSAKDVASFNKKVSKLAGIYKELESVQQLPPTRMNFKAVYGLVNQIYSISLPGLSRRGEPVFNLIKSAKALGAKPVGVRFPGLNYTAKHFGMRQFARELVQTVDDAKLSPFLNEAFLGRHIAAQAQRAAKNTMIPKALKATGERPSFRTADTLKSALGDVIRDWEPLVNLIYGLNILLLGKDKTWAQVKKVKLHDKVQLITRDPRLTGVAKNDWVTVRNALSHGSALFDASSASLIFIDNDKSVSWTLVKAKKEGRDILLANVAMLYCPTLVRCEGMLLLEPMFKALRAGKAVNKSDQT